MADEVRAAGGVLWRSGRNGVEVAVIHRPRYDDWSLPKGKLERAESAVAAAAREVLEETGFAAVVGRRLGESRYTVVKDGAPVPKSVRWWAMRATTGEFQPDAEVDELLWLPPDDALEALTQGRDGDPLRRLLAGPLQTRTLLLLRHGSAQDRAPWTADDDARPLDSIGCEQAGAAAAVLPLYDVRRLVAAPLERCRASLRPLAESTGLPVVDEAALGARFWAHDRDVALRRVLEHVADGATVACSQGEVIPGLVGLLAARDGVSVGDLRTPKGALWALSFDGDRLVDLDRVDDLTG